MSKIYIFFLFILLACTDNKPIFPLEPHIEFVSLSPNNIKDRDSFDITIRFTDGDGDLGSHVDDSDNVIMGDSMHNLYVYENRPNPDSLYPNPYPNRINNLTPNTKNPSIQGTIVIKLSYIERLDPDNNPSETFDYDIWLYDRAGNKSNIITTSKLTITE